jgi:NAD(P)H dehydrogenase (quinone)
MIISVVLAHPNTGSFNHAIAKAVVEAARTNGHGVYFHDLYEEGFDPILPFEEFPKGAHLPPEIEKHCKEISIADGIVIVHPNWWGQPPAILKGWVDRVIRPGVAYEFVQSDNGSGIPGGLLKAKSAIVFNTSNTETQREQEIFKNPLETIWKNCIFGLCGVSDFHRRMFNIIVTSSERQRKEWLLEVRQIIDKYYPV